MSKHSLALGLLVSLLGPSLAWAQGARPAQDQVEGRNAWLKRKLAGVTRAAHEHVVKLPGKGYGVVIKGGFVLTADQLLNGGKALKVVDARGRELEVAVHARDHETGVALLRFVDASQAPSPIALGSSDTLRIGQFVIVAGTGETPLAAGVVSATKRAVHKDDRSIGGGNMLADLFSDGTNQGHRRAYPSVIQHDSPLEPEEFGAPLLDTAGRLIGINVAYPFRGSAHAVGIDRIKGVLGELEQGATRGTAPAPEQPSEAKGERPWLGASVQAASPEELGKGNAFGLTIKAVQGPAQDAGLQAGDVVVRLDDKAFPDIDAFAARLNAKAVGDTVTLTVLRGRAGIETKVEVKLGKRP
ncbi:MAG: S1C family serine protease [Planctomycetota bacterium]